MVNYSPLRSGLNKAYEALGTSPGFGRPCRHRCCRQGCRQKGEGVSVEEGGEAERQSEGGGGQEQLQIWGNSNAHILWTLNLGGRDRRAQPPCGPLGPRHMHMACLQKLQRDRHRGEGVNVCPVLGRMWKGRRTGPSKPGRVAEGQKGAQDLGMRGSSRWRE